ncbi:TPA: hypothetical protein ACK8T7_004576 [Klebsiella aerogenes]
MTKSTITREQLTEELKRRILVTERYPDLETAQIDAIICKMALAAMDSEPVAYTDERNLGYIDRGRETAYLWVKQNSEASDVALYRHAQPAPVVPEDIPDSVYEILCQACGGKAWMYEDALWNACRAAMLQAQSSDDGKPTDDERIMAIEGIHNCERCGDEGWIVGEMGITRCACSQDGTLTNEDTKQVEPVTTANKLGNSPVIPDGYVMVPKEPTGKQWAAGVQAFDSGMDKVTRIYKAMLAAAPREVR